jgi:hypothetical protein
VRGFVIMQENFELEPQQHMVIDKGSVGMSSLVIVSA